MKFGNDLIRVAEISDPSWLPFWVNYKMLKVRVFVVFALELH